MKTAQALKMVAIGTAAIVGGVVIYRAYALAKSAGQGISSIPGQVAQAVSDLGTIAKEQAALAAQSAKQVYDSTVGAAVDTVSNAAREAAIGSGAYTPPEYIREVPVSQWDGALKSWVRSIKKLRNIKVQNVDGDFIGWKYFTDGTLISPAGEYFQRNDKKVPVDQRGDTTAFSEVFYNGENIWDVSKVLEQWQQAQLG